MNATTIHPQFAGIKIKCTETTAKHGMSKKFDPTETTYIQNVLNEMLNKNIVNVAVN